MRLAHYCTDCGHDEVRHSARVAAYSPHCACCYSEKPSLDPEPQVIETFDTRTFRPEPLHQPGSTYNAGTGHRQQLCNCERCNAKAAELAR